MAANVLESILTGEQGPKVSIQVGVETSTIIPLVGGIIIAVVLSVVISNLLFFKLYN